MPRSELKVIPQSVSPYYMMLFDESGVPQEGFDDTYWAFVEVGQLTIDFALWIMAMCLTVVLIPVRACESLWRISSEAFSRRTNSASSFPRPPTF